MTLALTLFFGWLVLWWFDRFRPETTVQIKMAALFVVLLLSAYPFTYGAVWWLRGLTGDLSILTTSLLAVAIYRQLYARDLLLSRERRLLQWSVVLVGILFYPLALGLTQIDPYGWGYSNFYFVAVILGLSLLLLIRGNIGLALVLIIALLAWNLHLLQSFNLWDYLIDPFLFFYFLARLVRCKV